MGIAGRSIQIAIFGALIGAVFAGPLDDPAYAQTADGDASTLHPFAKAAPDDRLNEKAPAPPTELPTEAGQRCEKSCTSPGPVARLLMALSETTRITPAEQTTKLNHLCAALCSPSGPVAWLLTEFSEAWAAGG